MSANLTINNGQAEMFSGNNIIPWHKQGTVVEGLLTAAEAIEAAHLDWEVEKVPLYYGESKAEYPKMVCVRRTDNNVPLSITNNTYTLIQNKEAFVFFDEIIGSVQAVYDTAGSIKNGAVVWLQASVPGNLFVKSRPDDTVEKRILFITSHNREFALTAMQQSAIIPISLRHITEPITKLKSARQSVYSILRMLITKSFKPSSISSIQLVLDKRMQLSFLLIYLIKILRILIPSKLLLIIFSIVVKVIVVRQLGICSMVLLNTLIIIPNISGPSPV